MVLYAVNLLFAWFASFGLSAQIGAVTGTSLYSERLVRGFDLGAFIDLINQPEVTPYSQVPIAVAFAGLFLVFQLFLTGGILTQYLSCPQRIEQSRFYAECGENFWKLVRIALVFIVIAGFVGGVLHAVRSALDTATETSPNRRAALAVECGMLLIEALALLWVRMWCGLAQTEWTGSGARRVRSSLAAGLKLSRAATGLYMAYVLSATLALLVVALGTYLWWASAPSSHVIVNLLILQSTLACLLMLRWWQRALAAAWYTRIIPPRVADAPVLLEPLPPESSVPEVPLSE